MVWYRYLLHSLKENAKKKRGGGIRVLVRSATPLPGNWLPSVAENRTNLFSFLAKCISALNITRKALFSTHDLVVMLPTTGDPDLELWHHEEADTRLFHYSHCACQGYRKIIIRTVDTDFVIFAVVAFQSFPIDELWVAFGAGKHYRYIPVYTIPDILVTPISPCIHRLWYSLCN